jgi:hypothetical protein
MNRIEIDIPETAREIEFFWELKPPEAKVFLYRFPGDPNPMPLTASGGIASIRLEESRTLYVHKLHDAVNFTFKLASWSDEVTGQGADVE